jgi:hypothetical protein
MKGFLYKDGGTIRQDVDFNGEISRKKLERIGSGILHVWTPLIAKLSIRRCVWSYSHGYQRSNCSRRLMQGIVNMSARSKELVQVG